MTEKALLDWLHVALIFGFMGYFAFAVWQTLKSAGMGDIFRVKMFSATAVISFGLALLTTCVLTS